MAADCRPIAKEVLPEETAATPMATAAIPEALVLVPKAVDKPSLALAPLPTAVAPPDGPPFPDQEMPLLLLSVLLLKGLLRSKIPESLPASALQPIATPIVPPAEACFEPVVLVVQADITVPLPVPPVLAAAMASFAPNKAPDNIKTDATVFKLDLQPPFFLVVTNSATAI